MDLAAKTGTAQRISLENARQSDKHDLQDNALIVGFTPTVKPQLAFAIVIENEPGKATRVAKAWLELYAQYYPVKNEISETNA